MDSWLTSINCYQESNLDLEKDNHECHTIIVIITVAETVQERDGWVVKIYLNLKKCLAEFLMKSYSGKLNI